MEAEPRFRISTKQTAKNLWYFDATIEYQSDRMTRTTSDADLGDVVADHLGLRLLSLVKTTEDLFREDGRKLVSDQKEIEKKIKRALK